MSDIIEFMLPLFAIMGVSLFVWAISNRSLAVLLGTAVMATTILIWVGILSTVFYTVVAISIGYLIWDVAIGRGSGSVD